MRKHPAQAASVPGFVFPVVQISNEGDLLMTMFRFGGAEGGEEGGSGGDDAGVEDSIDQGPWGLAAYAYYWWSGATGQV